jgi:hypothetical protein
MTDDLKPGISPGDVGYEHQDLRAGGIIYFLLGLAVITIICLFGIRGLYSFLDRREKAAQPLMSPLATNVPTDTRNIPRDYPQSAFPSPRLEKIEGEELDQDLVSEQQTLYSYGWVDEKAGTVHIPIEHAMDLLVQRGLPVRPQNTASQAATDTQANQTAVQAPVVSKGKKK